MTHPALVRCTHDKPWLDAATGKPSQVQIPYGTICTVVAVVPRADGTAAYVLEGWPMNWSAIGFRPVVKPSIEAVLKIVEAA